MARLEDLPLRDNLRGKNPYGAPQEGAPARLNVNENPYPPSEALVAAIAEGTAKAAANAWALFDALARAVGER